WSTATASQGRPRSVQRASASTSMRARGTSSSTSSSSTTRSASRRWRLLPLADVRVLAVEQFGAGPWATLQLADLGAEVIQLEDPASGGDVGRYVPPFQDRADALFCETLNPNKNSASLALRSPASL